MAITDHLFQLFHYQHNKSFVTILNNQVLTTALTTLQLKDEEQRAILEDTKVCLACGANRAAIVMGWALAFEHLRRWIFKSKRRRLADFNTILTSKARSRTSNYDPVSNYEDFFDLGERFIIDIASEAKLFRKQAHQVLLTSLTERNHFAHPSHRDATPAHALGYVEKLVVSIVANPDFQ